MSRYSATTISWAIDTYRKTRHQYRSRLECCVAIATAINAHENTVVRWINKAEGRSRALTAEEVPLRLKDLESEVIKLRAANRVLVEQVRGAS